LVRRLCLVLFIWMLVTGADFRCSFGSDPDNDRPDGPIRPPDSNRAPVASDAAYSVPGDQELRGAMPAVDPDGDALTWRIEAGPSLGSVRDLDSRRGTFTYVPDETGADSFSFRASDGRLDSNAASVRIAVLPAAVSVDRPIVRLAGGPGPDEVRAQTEGGDWLLLDVSDDARTELRHVVEADTPPLAPGAISSVGDPAGVFRAALFGPTPFIAWSDDHGATWRRARVPPGLRPVALSWAGDTSLAAATQEAGGVRLVISRDRGRTWQSGPGWPGVPGSVMSAVPDPGGGMAVYLASRDGTTIWMARIGGRQE
jgi:hypothetical protein